MWSVVALLFDLLGSLSVVNVWSPQSLLPASSHT